MTVTARDIANVRIQGGVVSQTRHYPGIQCVGVAQRVCLRDLQTVSTPLAKIAYRYPRVVAGISGDVFRPVMAGI